MPKMSTHEVDGSGVEEVTRARQPEKTVLPEMPCDITNKRSTARRNTKPSRQDTETEQQWPFPTKILGGPLTKVRRKSVDTEDYEEALF